MSLRVMGTTVKSLYRSYDEWTGDVTLTSDEIIIDEDKDAPVFTGILDVDGNPIYRLVEREPFGFVGSKHEYYTD